ncbi:uncharacterized protein PODANS_1_22740 [Podospora anserina S mat+]|uniref:Podospora anserina S mat+ genomic DNA chromosome 1, supercontig 6 n=1 Tax=Podospora anserina (strain S / ATCC MYA-4624 / DSM 980 / FGSC 10383) TaxID=515849 RepID=B2AS92_PODAN|nr:uncharacterized protein PODANS_1_22740 [Podospora anserina S mat+]CAP67265.1 unnamed protein product [Podospora anserina S mat+]CDP24676.1 Putative protein of unknown function [Podospora anserina S mat+]
MTSPSQTSVFHPEHHAHLIPYMAAIYASGINIDRTTAIGPFLPPLSLERLLIWWKDRIAEHQARTRIIILLLPPSENANQKPKGEDLRGIAMVELDQSQAGDFRGVIDLLIVGQKFRRQGGGRSLIQACEYESARKGRSLLTAKTETDSASELAFKSCGYVEVGKIPNFSRTSVDAATKRGVTLFYKEILLQTQQSRTTAGA